MRIEQYIGSSLRRLEAARQIADTLRRNEELHRLAMRAVFVLEDCYEALVRQAQDQERTVKPAA